MVERKRILAGTDVAGIDASQAEPFQMPDQVAVSSARLCKAPDSAKGPRSAAAPLSLVWRKIALAAPCLRCAQIEAQTDYSGRQGVHQVRVIIG